MISLQSRRRIDGFDGFGEALRVIREGRGDVEAAVLSLLQQCPGSLPILRLRFMGHQDAVMRILHHHHAVVRASRVVAINMTRCRRTYGKQLLKHLLWGWQISTHVINPSLDRRLGDWNQEQRGKDQSNLPETDTAHHREVARQPNNAVAHMLGGRDALDLRGKVNPLVLLIEGVSLGEDESVLNRIVER